MPARPWTVTDHDPLEKLEDNLWAVDATAGSNVPIRRRATFIKLGDGRLVIHNAIPLAEPSQQELERWGEPALLVVPNRFHRMDIAAYKARYPKLRVLCPAPARRYVEERVAVDGTIAELPADPALSAQFLDGSKVDEAVLIARSGGRVSLIWGDTYFNVPQRLPGFAGTIIHILGSTGGPRVTRIARWFLVADASKMRAHMERLADVEGLARLIPSHGVITSEQCRDVLRQAARTLG